jgi:signal peptidase I
MTDEHKDKIARSIISTIKLMIISLVIILPVRYFLAQPFYVNGASMEPNFHNNEYLITEELSYFLNDPKRGDIIVFKYPENPNYNFIKRIIGLPGEKISFKNGQVMIHNNESLEGTILDEPYLLPDTRTFTTNRSTYEIKEDEYFVMGDNRYYSEDSRSFGPIKKGLIIGRVSLRGWPLNRVDVFRQQSYNME